MRWSLVWLVAGCYSPGYRDCEISCAAAVCPDGFDCVVGMCRPAGMTQACGTQQDASADQLGDVSGDGAGLGCPINDPGLVACFGFDGDLQDSSGFGNHAAGGATFTTGKVGKAMRPDVAMPPRIGERPSLDLAKVTIQTWVLIEQPPAPAAQYYLFDNERQYGLSVRAEGNGMNFMCLVANGPIVQGVVPANNWTHLACTYDGQQALLYVNGKLELTALGNGPLDTTGTTGSTIGANNPAIDQALHGLLDELRIYDTPRTAAQICADAMFLNCQ